MRRYYTFWLYAVVLTAITAGAIQGYLEERALISDAKARASLLAASLEESILINFHAKRFDKIAKTVRRLQSRQKILGAALCVYQGRVLDADSQGFPASFDFIPLCREIDPKAALLDESRIVSFGGESIQYLSHRIDLSGFSALSPALQPVVVLVLARDLSEFRSAWIESFLRASIITLVLGLGLLCLVALQMRLWIVKNLRIFHRSLRTLIAGKGPPSLEHFSVSSSLSELKPISEDIKQLAKILAFRPKLPATERKIPSSLSSSISHKRLIVIANREPYIHQRNEDRIEVVRPASGLVTALEPILRQCGGLWVAHASGSADFDVTNTNGEIAVPPEKPTYTLKRVALTQEQEEGYYYGFSNEGLWPLCHLAHTRPAFRLPDWRQYIEVNQKFSNAIPPEALDPDSLYLIQDYHFALLPQMIKKLTGNSPSSRSPRISLFWHIPWPNPETFGICPWGQQLLRGMLGADVIGFHTQYHCNNFLESCNRYLEARIDYEHFSVTMGNHETWVRAFPIGIDTTPVRVLSDPEKEALKAKYGISARYVAVGVDRIDYTKGIVERVEAVERFLEKHPEYVGHFSLVQMGSPSRTHIPAYRLLIEQLEAVVHRVNQRFSDKNSPNGYRPVIFIPHHHEWNDIQYFYQLGDICMVTSLHDGMNLVAKEYVWCQKPERGSLILSKFTGASRELTEAFIVNPYAAEEMADAIAAALALSTDEKARRMNLMKEKVHGRNAYRWASELIDTLLKKRPDPAPSARTSASDRRARLG